ncbi:MAG: hypothetical protein JG782_1201 [Anaerophaga sp.]|nr:hypothetical protein [Anaerophaga sp.]MDN5291720.1 hypothetical protein [Anaerophaga sp.]
MKRVWQWLSQKNMYKTQSYELHQTNDLYLFYTDELDEQAEVIAIT